TAAPAASRRTVTDADSILAVLSGAAGPMRAREVSEKLGLEPLEANVNAVRTRLERLAKDGRAQRPGRGLYTATARGAGSGA
ncbi:prephenate dehydrogenase, partial [Kitasatospora purpeofusca]